MSYVELIKAPNNLCKAKIGEGRGKLDPAIIQRAEKAVERIQRDYIEWADEDLGALEATLAKWGPARTIRRLSSKIFTEYPSTSKGRVAVSAS